MRDVKATGRSRGENENGGIGVGSRLGKKGRLCRKTFVRLLCLTAAMLDLLPPLPEREVLPAAEAAEVVEVVLPIIIQAAAGDKADGRVRFRRFCLREPL